MEFPESLDTGQQSRYHAIASDITRNKGSKDLTGIITIIQVSCARERGLFNLRPCMDTRYIEDQSGMAIK